MTNDEQMLDASYAVFAKLSTLSGIAADVHDYLRVGDMTRAKILFAKLEEDMESELLPKIARLKDNLSPTKVEEELAQNVLELFEKTGGPL